MSVPQSKSRYSHLPSDKVITMTLGDLKEFAHDLVSEWRTVEDGLLTERQVLDQFPISRTRLFKLRNEGKVSYMKNGTRIFYRKSDINQLFIEQ